MQLKLVQFRHELLLGSLETGLINNSEDLIGLNNLIGLDQNPLDAASQLALHHNVLTGRANNA